MEPAGAVNRKLVTFWSQMAQNGTQRALEPRNAWTIWNKCLNWLLAIRTDHYEPFSAQEKVKFGVQKVLKWPKLAKNGPERLEQVGTNVGTGCSPSGLITINPLQHKKRPNFVSRRSQNGHYWLKMAQNDTKWPKMALSRLWSPERLELVGTNIGTGCSPSRLITMNPFQHKERPNSVSRRSENGQKLPNMAPQMPFWAILVWNGSFEDIAFSGWPEEVK